MGWEPADTWKEWLEKNIIIWAAKDPGGFIYTVLLCLTPFFILSGILAYFLAKDIEKKEKDKKRKAKREANIRKARGKPEKEKKDN
ncbi:small integral membrane protein 15-like [Saccoglossus kowalevskii]|uniref:Small integral membrane protein 15 n=1 Tax=Saccoglossus kowalevskii TaxID=10224 RepID=A0ABM0GN74_SACKO|nr:PREDICTED: small integral membrane protein 15-like [Saccoglossus kowalevskii]